MGKETLRSTPPTEAPKSAEKPVHGAFKRFNAIRKIFAATFAGLHGVNRALEEKDPELRKKRVREVSSNWAQEMLRLSHVRVERHPDSAALSEEPCLLLANHVSYMDIPVLHSLFPAAFVAKKEVRRWVAFGKGAAAIGTVFVDRNSARSRKKVAEALAQAVVNEKKSIILFPEGTSSPLGKPWKKGAFSIAHRYGFKVQPVSICYRPHQIAAYWGNDTFLFHLWRFLQEREVLAQVRVFEPISVERVDADCACVQELVQNSVKEQLERWSDEQT